ncbi:MAG: cyanophycin synthetase, partial [Actinomycetota bacterium]|nr:cyanophycin synthetase [Actinomycetota bacterium]
LITNIDGDHMDFFGSAKREEEMFFEFLKLLPPEGFAVVRGDNPGARKVGELLSHIGEEVIFYGRGEHNDYRASEIRLKPEGSKFVASLRGKEIEVENRVPGIHNVYNSIGAIALCHRLGFSEEDLVSALVDFKGVRRRFELVGSSGGVTVIDDYAHHPTEVKAVMDIASMGAYKRVVVIFQPHRYTRTRLLAGDFGVSLGGADIVVVTDIYSAGEDAEPGISGELVAESVKRHSPETKVFYVPDRIKLASEVVPLLRKGDLVLTIGAGDITLCGREIIEMLERG